MNDFIGLLRALTGLLSVGMAVCAVHVYNNGEIDKAIYVVLVSILFAIWSKDK